MNKLSVIVLLLVAFIVLTNLHCVQKDKSSSMTIYEDTELAILMRNIFDDAMQMKQAIKRNEKPVSTIDHLERILSVEATEPEKQKSAEYIAFANQYLNAMAKIPEANFEEAVDLYDFAILSCKNCHQALCPGPLVRVNKLIRK